MPTCGGSKRTSTWCVELDRISRRSNSTARTAVTCINSGPASSSGIVTFADRPVQVQLILADLGELRGLAAWQCKDRPTCFTLLQYDFELREFSARRRDRDFEIAGRTDQPFGLHNLDGWRVGLPRHVPGTAGGREQQNEKDDQFCHVFIPGCDGIGLSIFGMNSGHALYSMSLQHHSARRNRVRPTYASIDEIRVACACIVRRPFPDTAKVDAMVNPVSNSGAPRKEKVGVAPTISSKIPVAGSVYHFAIAQMVITSVPLESRESPDTRRI